MKVTKRQLKRIIKEEKTRLFNELGAHTLSGASSADRTIGLYFDINVQKQVTSLLNALYEGAIESAMEDGMDLLDAEEVVKPAMRQMFEDWLNTTGPGAHGPRR